MEATNPKKKNIIIAAISLILVITIPIILFIIDSQKSATLQTIIAPSFATITINNKQYNVNKDLHLKPTETTALISADGFQSQEVDIKLIKDQTSIIYLYLTPNDGDMSWYYNNQKEMELITTIGGLLASQQATEYATKYPVSTILPINVVEVNPETYEWTEYRIDSGKYNDCKSDFCVKITDSTGGNKEKALQKIRENGFNPDDYEIIYEYTPVQPVE